jgi:mannose-1-phosphate guanylyltransferase
MVPAMVLAAGLGSRLWPLTAHCAKALVPVGDRPVLAHILGRLRDGGVERVVLNAHHRAADLRDFVRGDGGRIGVSEEAELLGTAGGVARAEGLLGAGDVVVWNADIVAEVDVRSLVIAHAQSGAAATLAVRPLPPGEGNVGTDGSGRIVRLRSERVAQEVWGGEFVPVQVLGAQLRQRLPERGCLIGDVHIPALLDGAKLDAFTYDAPWHDVGSLGSYLDANLAWLDARGLQSWTGDGARSQGSVLLDRSILGAGATVSGAGVIARCVVWPRSDATAPIADSVVATEQVVTCRPRC